jgi:hypothetical protein
MYALICSYYNFLTFCILLWCFSDETDATEKTKKPTAVLNDVEEKAKAMVSFHAQLLWLKEFVDSNPSVSKVAEMELRYANGRVKEAFQAWSSNKILPLAQVWHKLLPHGNNSSFKMKSWVEKLFGKRPKARHCDRIEIQRRAYCSHKSTQGRCYEP